MMHTENVSRNKGVYVPLLRAFFSFLSYTTIVVSIAVFLRSMTFEGDLGSPTVWNTLIGGFILVGVGTAAILGWMMTRWTYSIDSGVISGEFMYPWRIKTVFMP